MAGLQNLIKYRKSFLVTLLMVLVCACTQRPVSPVEPGGEAVHTAPWAEETQSGTGVGVLGATALPDTASASPPLADSLGLDPQDWRDWPVLPVLTRRLPEIYQRGQALGNDPHALSIFGDCQSKPQVFLGVFETDPALRAQLEPALQAVVDHFAGSFNRQSPTVKDATTAGGLLWPAWHGGLFGCGMDETPVSCELRIQRPSFVIINTGTHWVTRNQQYLRTIIEQLLESGIVPILATKADDRYQGEQTNHDLAVLAAEFDLPLWNFWAAALTLPDHGVFSKQGQWGLGDVYLTEQALALYRLSALEALHAVWRAAAGSE